MQRHSVIARWAKSRHTPRRSTCLLYTSDAADVAFSTTFGPNVLKRFSVRTDEEPARPELVERLVA